MVEKPERALVGPDDALAADVILGLEKMPAGHAEKVSLRADWATWLV